MEDDAAALKTQITRLHAMLASASNFIARLDPDGAVLYLNRLAPGLTQADIEGKTVYDFLSPAHHERARRAIDGARSTGETHEYTSVAAVSATRMGTYLSRVSPIMVDGKVDSLILVATDVTELEDKRMQLQHTLDATGLGIWAFDPNNQAGTWDEKCRAIFGIEEDVPAPGLAPILAERIHPADRELVSDALASAIQTGVYEPITHRLVWPSGAIRWVQASGLGVRDEDGNVSKIFGGIMDITDRRLMEARLAEAQKLEGIGRLAGGIAHDFNNMLTTILGNLDFALSDLDRPPPHELRSMLEEVQLAAERSAALTSQLLAFARRQVIAPTAVDPNELLGRLYVLLNRTLGEHIKLKVETSAKSAVCVDPSQFEQVLLNLITNARDAMPGGGSVDVSTEDVDIGEEFRPDLEPGAYVVISVRDDGPGIDPDLVERVFEPFFSTRPGGTGLGLATCYGIVKQNGGHIAVESIPDRGTLFRAYFPRSEKAEDPPSTAPADAPEPGGRERLLVVEDEPMVRRVIERSLAKAGYDIMSAASPDDALEIIASGQKFALMITDVVMPKMSGRELADRVGDAVPRVLFISGYTSDAVVEDTVLEAGLSFLQKPFLPDDLLRAVRGLLDDGGASS